MTDIKNKGETGKGGDLSAAEKKERIDSLIKTLNEASRAYYDEAQEIMTNFEYDALYDELQALEEETGYRPENSPSINVGYEVTSALPKERHATRMLSLDKTKDREQLRSWLGNHQGLLSWKLDGLTVVLTYENGKLSKAVTRGNGDVGEVITDNARVFVNVPQEIPHKGRTVIRGEAVITYPDFEKINSQIDDADAKYKNPRNLCSGSVRQLDSRITAERHVNFFAFTLSSAENVDFEGSRRNQMEWMKEQGFDVVHYEMVDHDNLLETIDKYEKAIPDFHVPSDGLVLTLEDLKYAETLGTTAKFPRDSLAFKWRDQEAETTLLEIEWSPSRTGLLNPVAVFQPVELEGTTVSRASVHNINIMESLQLGIGDKIKVYKANMIIPQIGDNLTKSGNLKIPETCPVCGGKTEIREVGDTRTLVCTNPECQAKKVKKFSLFVSRDAMNIEGLSEATILKLMGKGLIHEFPDIFLLKEHRQTIAEMEGFGEKSADKLLGAIDRASHTTPEKILAALGIPGVGVVTAGLIAAFCGGSWEKIVSLSAEELGSIDGVGPVIARDYQNYFSNEKNRQMVDRLTEELDINEERKETGNKVEGKVFVITGSLEHYENRNALKAAISSEGGKVAGSVSGNTDYLITNDPESGSSKNRKARELGVSIITEEEIMEMLGQ